MMSLRYIPFHLAANRQRHPTKSQIPSSSKIGPSISLGAASKPHGYVHSVNPSKLLFGTCVESVAKWCFCTLNSRIDPEKFRQDISIPPAPPTAFGIRKVVIWMITPSTRDCCRKNCERPIPRFAIVVFFSASCLEIASSLTKDVIHIA